MPRHIENRTKKTVILGLMSALSLAVYAIESLIPPLLPVPGIKPGLSNIITLYCLRVFGKKEAGAVLLVRILISFFLFGNATSLIYSLIGGAAALGIEILCDLLLKGRKLCITGAFGGLFHNAGQLVTASLIMGSGAVFFYAPHLTLSGILTGCFTGLCAHYMLRIKIPENP